MQTKAVRKELRYAASPNVKVVVDPEAEELTAGLDTAFENVADELKCRPDEIIATVVVTISGICVPKAYRQRLDRGTMIGPVNGTLHVDDDGRYHLGDDITTEFTERLRRVRHRMAVSWVRPRGRDSLSQTARAGLRSE